jgi:hypothetical protein
MTDKDLRRTGSRLRILHHAAQSCSLHRAADPPILNAAGMADACCDNEESDS